MKIKKLVSAVAALAISVSAFAGWTVSTYAADTYTILYGTPVTDSDGNITGVDKQIDFTGDSHESTGVSFTDGNGVTVYNIGGSVLNTSATWTKDFETAPTTGKVYFAADYTVSANNKGTIQILDGEGKAIYTSTQSATIGGNGNAVVATINGTDITKYCRLARKSGYRIELVFDLDANSINYTVVTSTGDKYADTETGTITGFTASAIKGIKVWKTNYGSSIDNMYLYSVVSEEAKYEYSVNYNLDENTTVFSTTGAVSDGTMITAENMIEIDGKRYYITSDTAPSLTVTTDGNNILNVLVREAEQYTINVISSVKNIQLESASVIEGDSFTYSYPKYLTDENDKVIAVSDESTYQVTETPSESKTITVPYSEFSGNAWFSEGENVINKTIMSTASNSFPPAKFSNAKAVRGFQDKGYEVITIPEDGIYTITTRAFTNNSNDKGSGITVYKNSAVEKNKLYYRDLNKASANLINEEPENNVKLMANDKIVVQGAESNSALDYILLEKTGDLATAQLNSRVEYRRNTETTGALNFLSEVIVTENDEKPAEITDYGFNLVSKNANGGWDILTKTIKLDTPLVSGDSFHVVTDGFGIDHAKADDRIALYAIPWVSVNNRIIPGKAITYNGSLLTDIGKVVSE